MPLTDILLLINLLVTLLIIIFILAQKKRESTENFGKSVAIFNADLNKIAPLLREELGRSREESQRTSKEAREELSSSMKSFSDTLSQHFQASVAQQTGQSTSFYERLDALVKTNEEKFEKLILTNETKQGEFKEQLITSLRTVKDEMTQTAKESRTELTSALKSFESQFTQNVKDLNEQLITSLNNLREGLGQTAKEGRVELTVALKSFEDKFSQNVRDFNELQRQKFGDLIVKQEQLKSDTEAKLEKIRETVEKKLQILQDENVKKLDEMRNTVDEKLQNTLERRFNESFTVISNRLDQVHKGLGDMQNLAVNVGDLKKIMTNVKSRGVMGEYQLVNILEDLLTNEQYEKNVKTKLGSGAIVKFAIKMPNNNNLEKKLWLPIDSKFPKEDYEALVDAYELGDPEKLDELRKAFKNSIIKHAKDIKEKYIDPPNTTEYGVMFLPFESLYAEVLRTSGLFELLQNQFKVTIAGPTTLSALLSSLQMGFRTLAIEKRSSEVWDLLGAVKAEFSQFGTILEKTKKKLEEATNTIDKAGVRSRAIERQLRKVQELPQDQAAKTISQTLDMESQDIRDEESE